MSASMLLAIAAGILALGLLLLALALLLRDRRNAQAEATLQTALIRRALAPGMSASEAGPEASGSSAWHGWIDRLAAFGRRFQGSRLEHALLAREDRMLLDQAGWNSLTGAAVFLALRLLLALVFLLLALVLFGRDGGNLPIVMVCGAAAGVLLPKFALRAWSNRLRKQAADELPMLIDLLRLLQGVGMSMDQSLQMLGEQLRRAIPLLGRELQAANVAYMRGRSREQSLQRLAEVFDNEDLRSLVALVLQVHRHGGAVQEPLHQFAERLRERRRMELKEKVGKLSVKMTVVMMFTLLPALMLVLSGPAILALARTLVGMGD